MVQSELMKLTWFQSYTDFFANFIYKNIFYTYIGLFIPILFIKVDFALIDYLITLSMFSENSDFYWIFSIDCFFYNNFHILLGKKPVIFSTSPHCGSIFLYLIVNQLFLKPWSYRFAMSKYKGKKFKKPDSEKLLIDFNAMGYTYKISIV